MTAEPVKARVADVKTRPEPKIRDGLLDEATAWEEWYFQPIW